jgi:DNA-binding CsgD family transcriptional regulator
LAGGRGFCTKKTQIPVARFRNPQTVPKTLLTLLSKASRARDDDGFLEGLLAAWQYFAEGDYHSLTRRCMESGRVDFWHPGEGRLGAGHRVLWLFGKLWALEDPMGTHPALEAFSRNGPGVYLRSWLEPDREWRRRAHYRIVDKPLGISDMASVFLVPSDGVLLMVHAGLRRGNYGEGALGPMRDFAEIANSLVRARGGLAGADVAPPVALTRREIEILKLVDGGKRNAEVAKLLGLSVHTVRKHMENIFAKLGVETRTSAAREGRRFF